MPLRDTALLLNDAKKFNYCIGAFNIENLNMAKAVVDGAENTGAPVIIQTTFTTVNHAGAKVLSGMVRSLAEDTKADVALHLDHGNSVEVCKQCIDAGYTSVMIDASKHPLEKNIDITKKVVILAKEKNVTVEGEIGRVGGVEDEIVSDIAYTDVDECREFCQKTEINFVAIGVGTTHGIYKGQPQINFERISQINDSVNIPLVLHGASGLSETVLRECIKRGVSKINFATELRQAYTRGIREALKDKNLFDPKVYQLSGRNAVRQTVINKILSISI
ncbi:MAG: class II fructose-bisphosphate aldolase [Bacillota bacterium]